MFFIDSWIWIGLFSKDNKYLRCQEIIGEIEGCGGVINPIVLCEVEYGLSKLENIDFSLCAIELIEQIPNLMIIPVNSDIA